MTIPTTATDASATRFSVRIREATRDHERTERSPFITAFLEGRVSRQGFAAMTGQLWFIYGALEAGALTLAEDGVRCYRFERIDDVHSFKEAYRAHLDAAPWSEAERRRIIEESACSVRMTGAVLESLGPVVGAFVGS